MLLPVQTLVDTIIFAHPGKNANRIHHPPHPLLINLFVSIILSIEVILLEDKIYIIFVLSVIVFMAIASVVRLIIRRNRYKVCPVCGSKTRLKWITKREKLSFRERLRSKLPSDERIYFHPTIRCTKCDFKREI